MQQLRIVKRGKEINCKPIWCTVSIYTLISDFLVKYCICCLRWNRWPEQRPEWYCWKDHCWQGKQLQPNLRSRYRCAGSSGYWDRVNMFLLFFASTKYQKETRKWITKHTAVKKCTSVQPNYDDSKISSVFHVLCDKNCSDHSNCVANITFWGQ